MNDIILNYVSNFLGELAIRLLKERLNFYFTDVEEKNFKSKLNFIIKDLVKGSDK